MTQDKQYDSEPGDTADSVREGDTEASERDTLLGTVASLSNEVIQLRKSLNRFRTATICIALGVVFTAIAARATGTNQVIEAKQIWVMDDSGKKRAGLFCDGRGFPVLGFFDERFANVLTLGELLKQNYGLAAWDAAKRLKFELNAAQDGPAGLTVFDRAGRVRSKVGVKSDE
jgi:hypothetical protein